jgi:hypothetical protein
VTLDSKLTYRTHISCILHKANYILQQVFPTVNKSFTTDINRALVIHKSLLCSILTYASSVWGHAADTYINKWHFKIKVLRIVTKLQKVKPITRLHEQTEISLTSDHIKRLEEFNVSKYAKE